MSGATPNSGDIFDVKKIRRLVELMNEHDLAEIDLRQADQRIRLRRGGEPVLTVGDTRAYLPAPVAAPSGGSAPAPAATDSSNLTVIKSPMVGTFYMSPGPGEKPFVKVGDHVGPETVVCIVEAMKVMNQIPAEVSGQITAILVEDGSAVDFDRPLFKIDTKK